MYCISLTVSQMRIRHGEQSDFHQSGRGEDRHHLNHQSFKFQLWPFPQVCWYC